MPTLSQCLKSFLQVERRPQTNKQYGYMLNPFVTAIGPGRDITLVRYEDLLDYHARLRERNLKSVTLANHIVAIRIFFNWCVRRHYLNESPADDVHPPILNTAPRASRAVPSDELAGMVDCARHTSPRAYALILFMADTGCRIGGLASLQVDKIDFDSMSAWILEKGGRWHQAFFSQTTADALRQWLKKRPKVDHDYVWTGPRPNHKPMSARGLAYIIRRLAEKSGASRPWGPHSIRHAVGHAYARAQVPVTVTQRKLGHTDPMTTLKHYYPDELHQVARISQQLGLAALQPKNPEANDKIIPFDKSRTYRKGP